MRFQELTRTEQILLGSVVLGSLLVTALVILCIIWKKCWIYKYLWKDDEAKLKNSKKGTDDIICIRYPPDIYPNSIGIYRENVFRSPEDELTGLFLSSPIKRDSTYSSMSDGSNGNRTSSSTYELAPTPPMTAPTMASAGHINGNGLSPTYTLSSSSSSESPVLHSNSISPLLTHHNNNHQDVKQINHHHGREQNVYVQPGHVGLLMTNISPVPPPLPSMLTHPNVKANMELSEHQLNMIHNNNNRQPFFTFALKFEEENGLLHIDFIEAKNLPLREYSHLPCDVFFTIEIQPKRHLVTAAVTPSSSGSPSSSLAAALSSTRSFGRTFSSACKHYHSKNESGESNNSNATAGVRGMLMPQNYRFVTKTLKKVLQTCDFSEAFLAQLSKTNMKDYFIRFTAFDSDRFGNPTELGSTTLTFDDFHNFTNHKLILSCSLKEPIIKLGEIMVGLCHLPTAERVSLTIVKVSNLNPYLSSGLISKQSVCYVRVLLLRADSGKVLKRKKTTYQRCLGNSSSDQHPQFNETLVFDMPPSEILHAVFLVLVCITNKVPMGGSAGASPTTTMNLLPGAPAVKRHSTPDANYMCPPAAQHHQQQRRSVDEALFHYGDNLNRRNNSTDSGTNSVASDHAHSSSGSINEQASTSSSTATTLTKESKDRVVGKIALGYSIRNVKGKCHWEQMIRNPRNVATELHTLR